MVKVMLKVTLIVEDDDGGDDGEESRGRGVCWQFRACSVSGAIIWLRLKRKRRN